MPSRLLLTSLAFFLLAASSMASAQDRSWRVTKWTGEVSISSPDGHTAPPGDGSVVRPGDRLTTGPGSRAMLVRGADSVVVSENTVIQMPEHETEGATPTVLQSSGESTFDVESKPVQHFIVETPHLAAVVKGTQFVVQVRPSQSRVDVTRGIVEVSDLRSGQYAPVEAEHFAMSADGPTPGLMVGGKGLLPTIRQGEMRTPTVKGASYEPRAPINLRGSADPLPITLEPPPRRTFMQSVSGAFHDAGARLGLTDVKGGLTQAAVFAGLILGSCVLLAGTIFSDNGQRIRRRKRKDDGDD
jgi:hypothetical protein